MQHFIPMLLEAVDIVVINAKCSVPTEIIRVLENSTVTVVGVGGSVRKGKVVWVSDNGTVLFQKNRDWPHLKKKTQSKCNQLMQAKMFSKKSVEK